VPNCGVPWLDQSPNQLSLADKLTVSFRVSLPDCQMVT
jgi:hypothetical protein